MSGGTGMQALLGSLTESERALVRETERERMAGLDEDALVALHMRVRRARDKYSGQYRRASASRVGPAGGRGKAYPKGARDRGKAEVFEDALARVSRRLAAAARASAQQLKQERIAAARAASDTSGPAATVAKRTVKRTAARAQSPLPRPQKADRRPRTPDRAKRHATTRAATSRKQARRDSR